MATQDAPRILPQELHARLSRGEHVTIIDVRTEDARALHPYQIPEALWLPLAKVVESATALPRQGTLVTYCT